MINNYVKESGRTRHRPCCQRLRAPQVLGHLRIKKKSKSLDGRAIDLVVTGSGPLKCWVIHRQAHILKSTYTGVLNFIVHILGHSHRQAHIPFSKVGLTLVIDLLVHILGH